MEYIIIISILILSLIIIAIGLNIKIKDIKKIKELGFDTAMQDINNKIADNKQVCEEILNILGNKDVAIEESNDEKSQTCLYLVMQNKILLGNIKNTFVRIQTIAHECVHSVQNKKLLKFNFILSNFNILYFIIICFLTIFKISNKEVSNILLIGLIIIQFMFYIVRSFLETDAMIRAEYLSKEYLDKSCNLEETEADIIIEKYKQMNKIGIKLYNFTLACKSIVKPIVYCILVFYASN